MLDLYPDDFYIDYFVAGRLYKPVCSLDLDPPTHLYTMAKLFEQVGVPQFSSGTAENARRDSF